MFFIPFVFTKKTHYNSANKIAVYFITYLIPLFIISFLQCYPKNLTSVSFYSSFFLALISYVNLYEVGYIYNECETIKKEKNPTKRLSDSQLEFYEKHKAIIYAERFIVSIVLNLLLLFFISKKSVLFFSTAELATLLIYYIYNNVRGKITQFVYFFLSMMKYSSLIFINSEKLSLSVFIAAVFVFPIVRTMEYKAHYGADSEVNLFFRKYIIKYDVSKITVFRVWATATLLVISVALYLLNICNLIPVICCVYIFIYRIALFVAVKGGAKFKGYLKTDDNKSLK